MPEGEGETSNGATTTQTDGGTTADASTTPKPQTDAGSSTSGLAFMAKCTNVGSPGGCASGLQCYNFNSRGKYCTKSCTQTSDCAAPSTGCNGMGVCKAP